MPRPRVRCRCGFPHEDVWSICANETKKKHTHPSHTTATRVNHGRWKLRYLHLSSRHPSSFLCISRQTLSPGASRSVSGLGSWPSRPPARRPAISGPTPPPPLTTGLPPARGGEGRGTWRKEQKQPWVTMNRTVRCIGQAVRSARGGSRSCGRARGAQIFCFVLHSQMR